MKQAIAQAKYLCSDCAVRRGGTREPDRRGAERVGRCPLCNTMRYLACVTDWDWPAEQPESDNGLDWLKRQHISHNICGND